MLSIFNIAPFLPSLFRSVTPTIILNMFQFEIVIPFYSVSKSALQGKIHGGTVDNWSKNGCVLTVRQMSLLAFLNLSLSLSHTHTYTHFLTLLLTLVFGHRVWGWKRFMNLCVLILSSSLNLTSFFPVLIGWMRGGAGGSTKAPF